MHIQDALACMQTKTSHLSAFVQHDVFMTNVGNVYRNLIVCINLTDATCMGYKNALAW